MTVAGRSGVKAVRARPVSAGPTASAAEARAKVSPARAAAFEILTLVGQRKGHSDELMHSAVTEGLSPEDRNLATALVMGVLRWEIALDARIAKLLARPDQKLAEPVALALRMGAFQLLHMDRIPAHAALSESVELCRAAGELYATGMVNAVLRKLSATQRPGTRIFESTAAFAERLGHPLWMVERWVKEYGRDAALAICEYDQQEPGAGGIFVESTSDLPLIDDGSRLVAELAAAAMPAVEGRPGRVWDCCAAPGGKTLVLALRLAGAEIVATDVSAKRLAQTQARLRRYTYAEQVKCGVADAANGTEKDGEFDLILCDVPCSGTGTLARNPEIRHRMKPEELTRQAEKQRGDSGGSAAAAWAGRTAGVFDVFAGAGGERAGGEGGGCWDGASGSWGRGIDGLAYGRRSSAAWGRLHAAWFGVKDGALRTLPGVQACDGFFATVLERA